MSEPRLVNPILDILCVEEVPPVWLVPDMFLQGTLTALAGAPGVGKSYISYTIGLAVAAGLPAMSGIVPAGEPKRVVYFDQENSKQDRNKYVRRSWAGLTHGLSAEEIDLGLDRLSDNFWPMHFFLGGENWADQARYVLEIVQPHLVIFDTATPCFAIKDENDNAEATQVINEIRGLMVVPRETIGHEASVIVLKHAKLDTLKASQRSMRGAKAWQSAADAVMFQLAAIGRPLKSGLKLTRLEPDKTRAYGLQQPVFITPSWTNLSKDGLHLAGSHEPSREHSSRLAKENEDEDE